MQRSRGGDESFRRCIARNVSWVETETRDGVRVEAIRLTKEPGFHQWDVRGNAFGLLAGHPITPFVSMHHLEAIDPVFPHRNSLDGLKLLVKAMKTEPSSFLQRSICYDRKRGLSFSVSMGYVVQVFPKMVLPRELERPERTFKAWNKRDRGEDFDFDTRPSYRSFCNKPFLFFLKDVHSGEGDTVVSTYKRDNATDNWKRRAFCLSWALPVHEVQKIKVVSKPMPERWHLGALSDSIGDLGCRSQWGCNFADPTSLVVNVDVTSEAYLENSIAVVYSN